ncbi:MAG: hypothetical protein V1800_16490 [Candidatus Latescibacterota bacterium]
MDILDIHQHFVFLVGQTLIRHLYRPETWYAPSLARVPCRPPTAAGDFDV